MMKKILARKSGFTLVEMVVAITIFTIFISMVAGTYLYIARAQRDAGEIRKVYSGARDVMEEIVEDAREGEVFYECYEGFLSTVKECSQNMDLSVSDIVDTLVLVDSEGEDLTTYYTEDGYVMMRKYYFDENSGDWLPVSGYEQGAFAISSSDVNVEGLYFRVFPSADPYENYDEDDFQYQTHISVYMNVAGDTQVSSDFSYDLQTTISTRLYE